MKPAYINYITIFIAGLLCSGLETSYAQDTLAKTYPVAVLVQLRSEHNRIEALKKDRRYQQLAEVENDAREVNNRMILDFHNNFTYCPVYYYVDTNTDLIKKKLFAGILMQGDGSPAKDLAFNSDSGDYVIAYYGYAVSQSRSDKVQNDSSLNNYDPQAPAGKGLVILNDKFQQLTYFYKLSYDNAFFGGNSKIKKYTYTAKHFDIEYYPFAGLFNRKLLHRAGGQRVQDKPSDLK